MCNSLIFGTAVILHVIKGGNRGRITHQFWYLGNFLTMPSFSKPARMLTVSSGVPVTTCTLAGLHSATASETNSATALGREGMVASERTPTAAPKTSHLHIQTQTRHVSGITHTSITTSTRDEMIQCGYMGWPLVLIWSKQNVNWTQCWISGVKQHMFFACRDSQSQGIHEVWHIHTHAKLIHNESFEINIFKSYGMTGKPVLWMECHQHTDTFT